MGNQLIPHSISGKIPRKQIILYEIIMYANYAHLNQ